MPEERAPIRIRRARNAVTDPALRQFLTDKTNRNLLSGVTGFKKHLFLFTASVDGVRFFKSSKYHNSVYVFSLFNENIMRRCSQEDLDAFFILIVRCDDGSDLLVEEDNRDGTTHFNSLEERDKGETLTDRSENKVQSNRMVKQSLNGLEATTAPIKKTSNPVDLNFRMLSAVVLKDIKERGTRGFCIRQGSELVGIQFGIVGFRADMPASNFLVDSAGRLNSNAPCLKCDFYRRVFDPYLMEYLPCIKSSMYAHREKMCSLDSAFLNLDKGSYLRLLPFFMWSTQHPAAVDYCFERYPDYTDKQDAYEVLSNFISCLPETVKVTLFPEEMHANPYLTGFNSFVPSNDRNTRGWIDIGVNTHLKVENAVSVDMMHLFHNVFKVVKKILFLNPTMKDQKDVMMKINTDLNEARRVVHLQDQDETIDYFAISEDAREKARKRASLLLSLPGEYGWIIELVNGNDNPAEITAESKRVFCCSLLPYLMVDSMNDPKVWSLVMTMMIIGQIHNFDGPVDEAMYYQLLIHLTLFVVQMNVSPSVSTPYIHTVLHLFEYYQLFGPLKGVDTFHCESQYCGLAQEATGGSNPVLTTMIRQTIMKSCTIIANRVRNEEPPRHIIGESTSGRRPMELAAEDIVYHSIINWCDDYRRWNNDIHPLMTFLDIELCGGYQKYLATGLSEDTGLQSHPGTKWATPPADKKQFYDVHNYRHYRGDWIRMELLDSVAWDGHIITSLGNVERLQKEHFSSCAFGVTYSVNRTPHLFGISKYVMYKRKGGEIYTQALVFEIPIHQLQPFFSYPFCFSVDLDELGSVSKSYTLISMHRLHVCDLFFAPLREGEMYGCLLSVCIRQWQLFHNMCIISDSPELREIEL